MNYLIFFAFGYYLTLAFITGLGIFAIFGVKDKLTEQRSLFLGEALLLGNVLIVGELITFSLTNLYSGLTLWLLVSFNLFFLIRSQTREYLRMFFSKRLLLDPGFLAFVFFLIIFTFRNSFPLMDNDSHSTYLWIPKLWLTHGTSLFKEVLDTRAYPPHMEAVPYALGMVLFGQDTLFPGMINLMWRWIPLLLVFGYTTYRFNSFYGLAAALFIMLNDHFFYSGINYSVLLNGAVIAFIFAAVYNFWESRREASAFRFMIAIIFLSQIFATKGNMAIVVVFLALFMLLMQKNVLSHIKEILFRKRWLIPVLIAIYFTAFWFLRNYLVTGLATFPGLAGKFHIFGWTPESERVRLAILGGIDFARFLKYMNYLFIWPGVNPAKIVIAVISFLPLILLWVYDRNKADRETIAELCFWLTVSILIIMGTVLTGHQDPRYYRYGIGVMSFAAVYAVWFIFTQALFIKQHAVIAGLLIVMSLAPIKVILIQNDGEHKPSFQDNVNVLLNKLHTAELMDRFYPRNKIALAGYQANPDKTPKAAWHFYGPVIVSNFMLPERPHVGLWYTPVIQWDSYEREDLIVKDLRSHDIEWIMDIRGNAPELRFLTPEEFAKEAVQFERYLKRTYFDYGFPAELSATGL